MKRLRFVMLGGFLGAGKTTTLARLARHYTARGQKVGIVTNDQAQDLVDTTSLRAQGFPVEEVPGACFCCRFDELVGRVGQLENDQPARRDPRRTGRQLHGPRRHRRAAAQGPVRHAFRGGPVCRPVQAESLELKILEGRGRSSGFSPKAAYIFRKQLEEADAIVINRIDEMDSRASCNELQRFLRRGDLSWCAGAEIVGKDRDKASRRPVGSCSTRKGHFGRKILDIDYDTYAEGEAELGWLNSGIRVEGIASFRRWMICSWMWWPGCKSPWQR